MGTFARTASGLAEAVRAVVRKQADSTPADHPPPERRRTPVRTVRRTARAGFASPSGLATCGAGLLSIDIRPGYIQGTLPAEAMRTPRGTLANQTACQSTELLATPETRHPDSASSRSAFRALMRFLDCGAASRNMPPLSPGVLKRKLSVSAAVYSR